MLPHQRQPRTQRAIGMAPVAVSRAVAIAAKSWGTPGVATIWLASGLQTMLETDLAQPLIERTRCPFSASQTFRLLSLLPLITWPPSALQATRRIQDVCPRRA